MKFSPVGTLLGCLSELAAAGEGKLGPRHRWQLQVWDVRTRKLKWSVVRPEIISFDFSPDGSRLAFLETKDDWTHRGQKIGVCRAPSGIPLRSLALPDGTWGSSLQQKVQYGPDSRTLSVTLRASQKKKHEDTSGGTFTVTDTLPWQIVWFDTGTGARLRSLSVPEYLRYDAVVPITTYDTDKLDAYRQPNELFLSPDGKTVLVDLDVRQRVGKSETSAGTFPGIDLIHQLWVCDSNGVLQRQLTANTRLAQGFSFNGKSFLCAPDTRHLQIFDVQSGRLRYTLPMSENYNIPLQNRSSYYLPSSALISHDGTRAFVTLTPGDENKDTRIGEWNLTSGQLTGVFASWGTSTVSSSLALSADDTLLAHLTSTKGVGYENRVQVWRLK